MFSSFRFRERQQADASEAQAAPQSSESFPKYDEGNDGGGGDAGNDCSEASAVGDESGAETDNNQPVAGESEVAPADCYNADDTVDQSDDDEWQVEGDPEPKEAQPETPSVTDEFDEAVAIPDYNTSPQMRAPRTGRALAPAGVKPKKGTFTAEQRLLLLDTWQRSGLPAGDFAGLVGISQHTLYAWKKRFAEQGPAGLVDQPRGQRKGSRLPEITKRAILMLKQAHPGWGCERISDMLFRGPALPASATAVAKVLHEAGYETVESPTRRHPDKVRRFERARPNQLWQTDLFTFVLKRQNRRLHLVAFMDDHSRFIVSYGLHATASTALVLEALEAGIASYGPPEEILTDNGPQYVTWRGKSRFTKQLEKRGIRQIVAKPRRPQTLGKIERFWGTLWREYLEAAVFVDLADARTRVGLFVDYYNFQRVHRGIGGMVPADRFFGAAPEVLRTLQQRVAANALKLARHGAPKKPFYVTGQVEGQSFSMHSEGERLILRHQDGQREEVTLGQSPAAAEQTESLPEPVSPHAAPQEVDGEPATPPPPAPGQSALDAPLLETEESRDEPEGGAQ